MGHVLGRNQYVAIDVRENSGEGACQVGDLFEVRQVEDNDEAAGTAPGRDGDLPLAARVSLCNGQEGLAV